ncbi:MAG TPA: RNA polymerase sigma-70 factor [Chitinophagaceae bacterium]
MPSASLHNEKELLHAVAQGDEAAFTAVFDAYKDKIYTIALRLTGNTSIAEEIVQDVFLKIWLKRDTLTSVDHFRAYLFTTTRHHVFNALKRLFRRRQFAGELARDWSEETNDTDSLLLDKEYQAILQEAIGQLPPQQRQVYQMMKEQGLKREQVAELLHISPETVKQHLAQAMRTIRAFCMSRLDIYIALSLFNILHK